MTKQLAECQQSLQEAQTGLSGTSAALKGLVDVLGTHLRIPDGIQQALLSSQSGPVQHSVQQLPSLVSGFSSHDKPSTVKCTICIWWHPRGEYSRLSSCDSALVKSYLKDFGLGSSLQRIFQSAPASGRSIQQRCIPCKRSLGRRCSEMIVDMGRCQNLCPCSCNHLNHLQNLSCRSASCSAFPANMEAAAQGKP